MKYTRARYTLTPDDIEIQGSEPLGAGAGGSVWRGSIKATGVPVAVKIVRAQTDEDRRLLLNEVRTLIEAEGCPYLVQWYAGFASRSAGLVNIVLELMDHGSLASLKMPTTGMPPRVLSQTCGLFPFISV